MSDDMKVEEMMTLAEHYLGEHKYAEAAMYYRLAGSRATNVINHCFQQAEFALRHLEQERA